MFKNGCGLCVTFMSAAGLGTAMRNQQTATNTKRNAKSKATTAMTTTKFFFLTTANDNQSPFIFANQNSLKCCEFAPLPRALLPVLPKNYPYNSIFYDFSLDIHILQNCRYEI